MSNVFTLEDLDAEIEKKYEPFIFQVGEQEFTLVSLLRVSKDVRAEVQKRLKALSDSSDDEDTVNEDDTIAAFQFVLSSVTKHRKGSALIRALGDDLVRWSTLMEKWQEKTQPGEASSSQN